jgi:hypothetical protein
MGCHLVICRGVAAFSSVSQRQKWLPQAAVFIIIGTEQRIINPLGLPKLLQSCERKTLLQSNALSKNSSI